MHREASAPFFNRQLRFNAVAAGNEAALKWNAARRARIGKRVTYGSKAAFFAVPPPNSWTGGGKQI